MDTFEIRQIATAYQKSRILLTAYELDIFTFIDKNTFSSDSIAEELNLNKDATRRLLNVLVAMKFLEKQESNYRNSGDSLKYLSKNSPGYIAGLAHSNHLWNTWSHLTDAVKTGRPAHHTEINQRGEGWLEAFISAMHDRGKTQASAQVSQIDLDNVKSVLDVGGGSGVFCMAFINRKPGLKAAIFDLPNVIPISKKIIEKEGYSGRIEHYTGDYTTDALPGGFDLVFLSAVIHSNSYETNRELVKNCYNSLNPNGKIVIQDWIMSDDKTQPAQGAIFSINMLVGVEGGDCYSEREVREWLKNAGFSDIKKTDLETGTGQVTAIKSL